MSCLHPLQQPGCVERDGGLSTRDKLALVATPYAGTGDLLATVVVAVPSHLPDKARQALDDFEAAMPNENPRDDLLSRARNA